MDLLIGGGRKGRGPTSKGDGREGMEKGRKERGGNSLKSG